MPDENATPNPPAVATPTASAAPTGSTAPQSNAAGSSTTQSDPSATKDSGGPPKLSVNFFDAFCEPIQGLKFRLVTKNDVFEGTTDAEGKGGEFVIKPNTRFDLQVVTDRRENKTIHSHKMPGGDVELTARSGSVVVPIKTEVHEQGGSSATPPPPSPPAPSSGGGGAAKPKKVEAQHARNENGHPVAVLKAPQGGTTTWRDAFKKSLALTLVANPATLSPFMAYHAYQWWKSRKSGGSAGGGAAAPPELDRLIRMIHFAKSQCAWLYATDSGTIYEKLIKHRGDYIVAASETVTKPDFVEHTKEITKSDHKCYKYVKVSLAMGEYTREAPLKKDNVVRHVILGGDPARVAGGFLIEDGWVDVSDSLYGDPLLAAPGDVIVYKKVNKSVDFNESKRKVTISVTAAAKDAKGNEPAGHIEIRTYDGFVSDYWKARPVGVNYQISGIYRKSGYSDLWPIYRLKAFLRVLEKRETGTVALPNDKKPFALNTPLDGKAYFSDSDLHPWFGRKEKFPSGHTDAAGRYQIRIASWHDAIQSGYGCNIKSDFSDETQTRVALNIMLWTGCTKTIDNSDCRTVLALIREGGRNQIAEAVKRLAVSAWTSLPKDWDKPHPNLNYSMKDFLHDFEQYTLEESQK